MPRTMQEILEQADELAARFEEHEPDLANVKDATALRNVRAAFADRARAEQAIADAVSVARAEGHSWSAIGAMLGTSGEAARQRYGAPETADRKRRSTANAATSRRTGKAVSKTAKRGAKATTAGRKRR